MSDGPREVHTGQAREARPVTPSSSVASRPRPVSSSADLLPRPAARPRIVDESAILGLSRVSRGRIGSRLFTAFFVFVFALIAVQMVVALLTY